MQLNTSQCKPRVLHSFCSSIKQLHPAQASNESAFPCCTGTRTTGAIPQSMESHFISGQDNVLSPVQGNPRGIYVPEWIPKQTPKVMKHWITFKPENHSSWYCTALSQFKVWAVGLLTQAKSWALLLQGSVLVYLYSTELHIMAVLSQSKLRGLCTPLPVTFVLTLSAETQAANAEGWMSSSSNGKLNGKAFCFLHDKRWPTESMQISNSVS